MRVKVAEHEPTAVWPKLSVAVTWNEATTVDPISRPPARSVVLAAMAVTPMKFVLGTPPSLSMQTHT